MANVFFLSVAFYIFMFVVCFFFVVVVVNYPLLEYSLKVYHPIAKRFFLLMWIGRTTKWSVVIKIVKKRPHSLQVLLTTDKDRHKVIGTTCASKSCLTRKHFNSLSTCYRSVNT